MQQDLVSEDVMLLDVGDALFVWLGIHSNQQGSPPVSGAALERSNICQQVCLSTCLQEKVAALESAKEYLEYDPSDRDHEISISVVKQGHEPPHFTGFFGAWDRELFKVSWVAECGTYVTYVEKSFIDIVVCFKKSQKCNVGNHAHNDLG